MKEERICANCEIQFSYENSNLEMQEDFLYREDTAVCCDNCRDEFPNLHCNQ